MKSVRVLKIDPEEKMIYEERIEAESDEGIGKKIREYIGGFLQNAIDYTIPENYGENFENVLYADEEGRLKNKEYGFFTNGLSLGVTVGRAVLLRTDEYGEDYKDTPFTEAEVMKNTVFLIERENKMYIYNESDREKLVKWQNEIQARVGKRMDDMRKENLWDMEI